MNRTQQILLGVLALQVLLIVLTGSLFGGGSVPAERQPLVADLEELQPGRLQVSKGDDESVVLERGADGWVLADVDGYPVDPSKVDSVLESLGQVEVGAPVVTSSRYHESLEVTEDTHQCRVRAWKEGASDPEVDLYLGSSPNYRVTHVRRGGDDAVYEARGVNAYDFRTDAASWVERKFVDIPFDDVSGVELSNAHGTFELEQIDGEWTVASGLPAGKTLDATEVDSFVRSLISVWLSEPAGRVDETAHGLDSPAATVTIRYSVPDPDAPAEPAEDPAGEEPVEAEPAEPRMRTESVTFRVGAEVDPDGEGKRYAARSGFAHSVILSKYDAERATEGKLADLFEGASDDDA
jgi:hypothetical protein